MNFFTEYEGQDVLPTFWFKRARQLPDAGWVRYLKLVSAFQSNNLQPAWDTNWNGAVMSYSGTNGTSATVDGQWHTGAVRSSSDPAFESLIYQRVHASNQINSYALCARLASLQHYCSWGSTRPMNSG